MLGQPTKALQACASHCASAYVHLATNYSTSSHEFVQLCANLSSAFSPDCGAAELQCLG